MDARIALLMVLLTVPFVSHAQTFKCRTPSGKMEFSDSPCAGGSQTERIQSNEYISPGRQRQAHEVQARNASEVERIEGEKAANNQQISGQLASQAAADKRQQAVTDQQKALEMARNKSVEANERCVENATRRRNSSMLAECKGLPNVKSQENPWDVADTTPAPFEPKPQAIIKNCIGNSCSDQFGQRYTTQAGKTVRSDGKRCHQQGSAMYCD
jgi:hypothetical protein